jgi:hypothetical protein
LLLLALSAGCGRIGIGPIGGSDGGGDSSDTSDSSDGGDDGAVDSDLRMWWDPAWSRRIKLTLGNVGPNLVNFPVMVRLDTTRVDYAATQNLGQDLRFIDADGATVLAHELEVWNEAGASYAWVKIPLIDATSSTDHVWLYYGNPAAAPAANAAAVWTGHALVWHLAENPAGTAPQIRDSTANANHGSSAGAITAGAQGAGQVAGSLAFDGTDDWITAANSQSLLLAGDLTISTWVRVGVARAQWLCDFVTPSSEQEVNNHLFELAIDSGDRIDLHWEYGAGSDTNVDSSVPLATPIDTWMMISVTRDTSTNQVTFYENGAQLGAIEPYTNNATGGTASTLWVAGEPDTSSSKLPLRGRQDELRIAGVVRSSGWIAAEYRSMIDAMVLYGATELY